RFPGGHGEALVCALVRSHHRGPSMPSPLADPPTPPPPVPPRPPLPLAGLLGITAVAIVTRLAVLPRATEGTMDPDAAHVMNVARCFARGQGFSNPAAWPAWMQPAQLPMPETFKEPGYAFLIFLLGRTGLPMFQAGQLISLLAGVLAPGLTFG